MESELIIKRILQVVSALLAVVLVVLLVREFQERQESEKYYEDKYVEAMPLRAQKRELEQQLAQVERAYQVKINGKGTLTLLCMDMTEDIYTVIYPQMQEYGYIGLLAVTEETLPGAEDYGGRAGNRAFGCRMVFVSALERRERAGRMACGYAGASEGTEYGYAKRDLL